MEDWTKELAPVLDWYKAEPAYPERDPVEVPAATVKMADDWAQKLHGEMARAADDRVDALAAGMFAGRAHGKQLAEMQTVWGQIRLLERPIIIQTPRGPLTLSVQEQRDLIEVVHAFNHGAPAPRDQHEWVEALVHVKGLTAEGQELDALGWQFGRELTRWSGEADGLYRGRILSHLAGPQSTPQLAAQLGQEIRDLTDLVEGAVVDPHQHPAPGRINISVRVREHLQAQRPAHEVIHERVGELMHHRGDHWRTQVVTLPVPVRLGDLNCRCSMDPVDDLAARCRRKVREMYGEKGDKDA